MDDEAGGRQRAADQHLLCCAFRPGAVGELVAEAAPDTDVHLHEILAAIVVGIWWPISLWRRRAGHCCRDERRWR